MYIVRNINYTQLLEIFKEYRQKTGRNKRKTNETDIELNLNIDGTSVCKVETGMPFFEHMIEQICRHGQIDLIIKARVI